MASSSDIVKNWKFAVVDSVVWAFVAKDIYRWNEVEQSWDNIFHWEVIDG